MTESRTALTDHANGAMSMTGLLCALVRDVEGQRKDVNNLAEAVANLAVAFVTYRDRPSVWGRLVRRWIRQVQDSVDLLAGKDEG